jgi:hypothetical protein
MIRYESAAGVHADGQLRTGAVSTWPGYATAGCALAFAAVSFYWGRGGSYGLDLVGQEAVQLTERPSPAVVTLLCVTGLVKVAGGVLALALVQTWGRRLIPRRLLLATGWVSSAVLVLYGGGQLVVQLMALTGVLTVPADMDWRGFYGHLCLWDPWFLAWGVLLALATHAATRRPR